MQLKGKGMQLKVKDMQLKVSMQKNIGERGSRRDICSLSSSLVFFYSVLLTSSCGLEENTTSHTCIRNKNSFLTCIILSFKEGSPIYHILSYLL